MTFTSRRSVVRSFGQNIAGAVVAILITIVTVPKVIDLIGAERFGVLSIVWLIVGYFGLLDLGLSRATVNKIAKLGKSDPTTAEVFWSAIWANCLLGVLSGALLYFVLAPFLTQQFNLSPPYRVEIGYTATWMAIFVPIAMVGGVFVGALEAREKFGIVNTTQVLGTILVQVTSLFTALLISPSLSVIVPATIAARTIPVVFQGVLAINCLDIDAVQLPRAAHLRQLFRFGGWITITSIVGPLLTSIDQFVIGAMLGAASVTHYSVPYSVITRLNVIPQSLIRALFPRLSRSDAADAEKLEKRALLPLGFTLTAVLSTVALWTPTLLRWWLGTEFSHVGAPVAIVLLIGLWFNGLAMLPFTRLQAQGRPDLPAKAHMLELVPYAIALTVGIWLLDLRGAAIAWSLRVFTDAAILFWLAGYGPRSLRALLPGFLIVCTAAFSATFDLHPMHAIGFSIVAVLVTYGWAYFVARDVVELSKGQIVRILRRANVLRSRWLRRA